MPPTERPSGIRRRVVVMPGMHRAGTSVVARGLMALGCDLGDALMAADERMNARGFFEDVDIVKLNDGLLGANGADWKSVALLADVDWSAPPHTEALAAARVLLERRLERSGQFAFKDPRVARLLPFWQRLFEAIALDDAYVIAVRHPRSVIDSLAARDGLDPRRSAWLWLIHVACALRFTQGRRRLVVDYDRMLAAPQRELSRIARVLELPPAADSMAEAAHFAGDFVSGQLRHSSYAPDELPVGAMPPDLAAAHRLLQRLARDEADPAARAVVAEIDTLFDRLLAEAPLLDYAGSVEQLADDVPRISGELAWARSSLAEASAYSSDLRASLAPKDTYIADLETTLARKEDELAAAHGLLRKLEADVFGRLALRRIRR